MQPESDKWGWKHVSVFGGFDKGSGTKRWKCNHCNLRYNGSYSRVRAHLLGFTGVGVKSCPAIDSPLREAFHVLEEERAARKRKRITGAGPEKPGKRAKTPSMPSVGITKEDVDDVVARFVYANGLSFDVVDSPYFREMIKAVAFYGSRYRPPTADELRGSFLTKEKVRIEKSMAQLRESWPKAGCSVLCVGCSETQVHIFVSSPRGLVFLKAFDAGEGGDGTGDRLAGVLNDVIAEIGPASVLQVVTHLNGAKTTLPNSLVLSTKFPRVFVSRCTSQSLCALMEEIAETDWIKPVVVRAKEIEQCVSNFQGFYPGTCPHKLKENSDAAASKYAPFFCTVRRVRELKQALREAVVGDEWKQWKESTKQQEAKDVVTDIEAAIVEDSFWSDADSFMQLIEPFMRTLSSLDMERMGEVCEWRVRALEEARSNERANTDRLNGLEELIEKRWDAMFSPLHAASYILNPRHFGKGQKDKVVMRGWKAAVEKYEGESVNRRALREQLSSYWRSSGDEDTVDCRDKMEAVAWWENFGFETPDLQTLAVNVLSQVSSCTEVCRDHSGSPSPGTLELHTLAQDLAFVQNNLMIHTHKVAPSSGSKTANPVLLLE